MEYDDTNNKIVEKEGRSEFSYFFYAKFGMEFKIFRQTSWLIGLGVINALFTSKTENEPDNGTSEMDILLLSASTGIEYMFNRRSIFSFSFLFNNNDQNMKNEESGNIFMQNETTIRTLNAIMAFTKLF